MAELGAGLGLLLLTGCGGGGSHTNSPTPPPPAAQAVTLSSGSVVLSFPNATATTYGVNLHDTSGAAADAGSAQPAQILVCTTCTAAAGSADLPFAGAAYVSVARSGASAVATATLASANGSSFQVVDTYTPSTAAAGAGAFIVDRKVTVTSAAAADAGFNSRYDIAFSKPAPLSGYRVFAPGVWYDHNALSDQSGAFGTDTLNANFFWRETRSTLPLVMLQDDATGSALSLVHINPQLSPGHDNNNVAWMVDPTVQYGSLGLQQAPQVDLGFIYPGSEGDGSYVGAPATKAQLSTGVASTTWVRRSHPVTAGFSHAYTLEISLKPYAKAGGGADFQTAFADTWNAFRAIFNPPVAGVPASTVYADGIDLINRYVETVNGATGLPFGRPVSPTLTPVNNPVYEMGFVGQQIPLGFQLVRDGVLHHQSSGDSYAHGLAMLNFWANTAAQPSGLPLTNYDANARAFQNTTGACPAPIFTRTASDGMEGMVLAAVFMRQHGQPQRAWERFAQGYGDWLVAHQNGDGSFYRAYTADGAVYTDPCTPDAYGSSKFNTTHPVRFLVELYFATGAAKYLTAAKAAGQYALANIYGPMHYIGGTEDNPNVIDKEGGVLALHAALALLDAAVAQKDTAAQATWLAAARQAADFTQTWQYAWSFPIGLASGVPATGNAYPAYQYAGTRALGLIALGQSSADISLSYESYDYFRLYVFGGAGANDPYLATASYLFNNTKLTTQLTGVANQQFGYTYDGLLGEGVDLSAQLYGGGMSSYTWLPWETNAELDPLQRLQDTFNASSIESAASQAAAMLSNANQAVYAAPGSVGWGQ